MKNLAVIRFKPTLIILAIAASLALRAFAGATLTFEERVKAQEAIERVYYSHRIWPKENPGPKPPFEEMVPKSVIEAKVVEYLRKSSALEEFWQRPIEPEQLQAEIERMAAKSKEPATLRELFAALGDNPELIAECLARPIFAHRYTRQTEASSASERDCDGATAVEKEWFSQHPGDKSYRNSGYRLPVIKEGARECNSWVRINDIPDSRTEQSAVWTGSEMIIWGGGGPSFNPLRSGGRYNPATDTWVGTSEDGPVPLPRMNHVAVWTGKEMVIWGGRPDEKSGLSLSDGGRYDPLTDTWRPMADSKPAIAGRTYSTAVWTGSEMLVWGGRCEYVDGTGYYESPGGRYCPESDSWSTIQMGDMVPTGREGHTAVWTGSEMIIWGGGVMVNHGWTLVDGGGRYNPVQGRWASVSSFEAPANRSGHTAVWAESRMVVWGGVDDWGYTATGASYLPDSDSWVQMAPSEHTPSRRFHHTAIWTGREMVVWAGAWGGRTGGLYDPFSDIWKPMSVNENAPPGGWGQSAVWTGSEMLIFGGYGCKNPPDCNGGSATNKGGKYDPSQDVWLPAMVSDAPAASSYHTAVWTGNEMVVWGGNHSFPTTELGTGWIYHPATDSWTATSVSQEAPSMRAYHTAIWTGREMAVWGGSWRDEEGKWHNLDDGSSFDVASNSWVRIPVAAGSPSARRLHTAVWTGKEMLIWGGYNTGSGGGWNPETRSWRALSTLPPSPAWRYYQASVWTGREMLIWGGKGLDTEYGDGGAYDPTADGWLAIPIGSTPTARYGHIGLWTGHDMLMWGGGSDPGGLYSPESKKWEKATTTVGAPERRSFAMAVWTGSRAIIWGGEADKTLNTGGLYDPVSDAWEPTGTGTGCPLPRSSAASAVWTGREMIVWGGGYDSGGTYLPCLHASAWAGPVTGTAPLTVNLEADASGGSPPYVCSWDFGDGSTVASGTPVSHIFANPGEYVVRLVVQDNGRAQVKDEHLRVRVEPPKCSITCEATASPSEGQVPFNASFLAAATTTGCTGETFYLWDFGDGTTSSSRSTEHSYAKSGEYLWTMTVSNAGTICSRTGQISAKAPVIPGDCDGDGSVSIGELQKAINMFLSAVPPECGVDCDGDGKVSIGELQKVINAFLGFPANC